MVKLIERLFTRKPATPAVVIVAPMRPGDAVPFDAPPIGKIVAFTPIGKPDARWLNIVYRATVDGVTLGATGTYRTFTRAEWATMDVRLASC